MVLRRFQPPTGSTKINVTPLIDVVMCLIVFYLIVGKLAADNQAKVNLPGSASGVTPDSVAGSVITIAPPDAPAAPVVMMLDGQVMSAVQLTYALRDIANGPDPQPVQLRADRRLSYGQLRPVIDACRDAGLPSVRLTTQRAGGGGGSGGSAP